MAIAPYSVAGHHGKESSTIVLAASLDIYMQEWDALSVFPSLD